MKNSWWQTGVIYQIYPRSFQDANADGIGDLPGITSRLDYFVDLGVDAIWISPIFPSPMIDFGYDVADYCGIDPQFGTLADFDHLLSEAHKRGLRVLLDFVPNHSSDQHAWFKESRASRSSPKRDWYLWHDGRPDGRPPNNWISDFGGSAWQWDETTSQYYYHAFLPEQPDLNWRNPEVRAAMYDAMRFWFSRGVDGFRIDVLWHMIKDAAFTDNPFNPDYRFEQGEMFKVLQTNSTDQPEVFDVVREMRALADEFPERVLIGEIYLPFERLVKYYGADQGSGLDGVQMPFNFELIKAEWSAPALHALIAEYEAALPKGAWPNWVLGNHDRSRIASRVGPAQARVAAMLLLTLRGTPTMYYGDELGLEDVSISLEHAVDPRELREPGLGLGRDPERTPMPWLGQAKHAGFSQAATTWLPMNGDALDCNVATQSHDPFSIFNFYRELLSFRRSMMAVSAGSIELLPVEGSALMYLRTEGTERVLVALNFSNLPADIRLPRGSWQARLSTHVASRDVATDVVALMPNEGAIFTE